MPTTAKLSPTAVYAMGSIANYLAPRLAQDAKVDLKSILLGTTAKNLPDRATKIARDVKRAVKGRLAQDADVDDVEEVIDAIQEMVPEIAQAASEPDPDDVNAVTENDNNDDAKDSPEAMAKALEFLKDKLSPEDLNAFTEMMGEQQVVPPAEDETEEMRVEREKKEAEDMEAGNVRDGAMDAKAVKRTVRLAVDSALSAERDRQNELRAAEKFVRPIVGDLAIACDSADEVYAHALEMRGIAKDKIKGMHPSAYRPLLEAMQTAVPRRQQREEPVLAADSKAAGSFRERFPKAANIRVM